MPRQIISGGQTGVDRAALDAAAASGIPCGGWCPRGRRAEDGPLDPHYPLRETPRSDYGQRTSWNVRDSDATLILYRGALEGGTALTERLARRLGRPCLRVELGRNADPSEVRRWLARERVEILNVAGPRESGRPGIYREARLFLEAVFGCRSDPP